MRGMVSEVSATLVGHDDATVVRRLKYPLLVRVGQPAEERKHVGMPVGSSIQPSACLVDVLLGGKKHQDVPPAGFFHDPVDSVDGPVDIGVVLGVAARLFERTIVDFHRMKASRDLDDRGVVKGV